MQDKNALREKLLRQAETILPPELAILIECAFEGESEPGAAEFLRGLIARFNECAELALPLHTDGYRELCERETNGGAGLLIGLLAESTIEREAVITSSSEPGEPEFDALVADAALGLDLSPLAPVVLGVGIAADEDEAAELARTALFRPADKHSPDEPAANAERRILARLNSRGPGAGGLGGRHTALAVAIEHSGNSGYIALAPGDYFTRRAYYVAPAGAFPVPQHIK